MTKKENDKKKDFKEKTKKVGCSCGGEGFSISIIQPRNRKSDDEKEE